MNMMNLQPVTLSGERVRLEPLTLAHVPALWAAGQDPLLWELNPTPIYALDDMQTYVAQALAEQARGVAVPFATVLQDGSQVIGSTRFGNITVAHRGAEIGWTWINPAWQRTFVNTEAKYLMLSHAFETWDCIRVELKTDVLNQRSRNAILRLGAVQEGIFRNHIITANGRRRDSVYFSILDREWPAVKQRLETALAH